MHIKCGKSFSKPKSETIQCLDKVEIHLILMLTLKGKQLKGKWKEWEVEGKHTQNKCQRDVDWNVIFQCNDLSLRQKGIASGFTFLPIYLPLLNTFCKKYIANLQGNNNRQTNKALQDVLFPLNCSFHNFLRAKDKIKMHLCHFGFISSYR